MRNRFPPEVRKTDKTRIPGSTDVVFELILKYRKHCLRELKCLDWNGKNFIPACPSTRWRNKGYLYREVMPDTDYVPQVQARW